MESTIHLFGSLHVDRPTLVRSELESFYDDTETDAVFLESPPNEVTPREWLRYAIRTPLLVVGIFAYAVLMWAISALLTRDFETVDVATARSVANEREIPVYHVDPQSRVLCSYGGHWFALVNWVGLLGTTVVLPRLSLISLGTLSVGVTIVSVTARVSETLASILSVLVAVGWLGVLAIGYLSWVIPVAMVLFVVTARRTIADRNQQIAERVETIVTRNDVNDGVLVLGRAHLNDVQDSVSSFSSVGHIWMRSFFRGGKSRSTR